MIEKQLIPTQIICSNYNIEASFVNNLCDIGLIHIEIIEQREFIHQDQICDLEKMIRLHNELNLNLEGIDIVFNLLQKEKELKAELTSLRNKLRLYESE